MTQPDAYRMLQRRAKAAGIKTKIGNHSLRATGITDYLKHDGTLENAQQMANHSSPPHHEALRPAQRRSLAR
jgi:integrase